MNKQRILLIDDELSFTRLLKLNLESTGKFEVKEVNAGRQGMAAVKDFQPDLILLDVMMPGIDGGTVAAQLQEHAAYRRIPIVFLTAAVKREELGSQGGVIGGFPYLAKPVDVDEVVRCIETHLAKKSGDQGQV